MLSSLSPVSLGQKATRFLSISPLLFAMAVPGLAHAKQSDSDAKIQIEVSKALFASGQQANNALNQLSAARAALGAPTAQVKPVDPNAAPPALRRPISITWNGRADHLVKKIAESVGYAYRAVGPHSAAPSIVTLVFTNLPAVDALQQVGLRVNHSAQISVDASTQTIVYRRVLSRSGISGSLMSGGR